MAVALRRTLPTLLASAATVTCAMICLLAAQSASLHGLGPVGAFSIVSALLAQTTFLPALLLVLGRAAFWPGQPGREQSRVWSSVGTRVAHRPALVALAAVALLGAACTGLAALHLDNDPLANVKGSPGSVTGARVLAQLPSVPITEVGIAVALGVLLDTLLVRTVLVPADLLTIGSRVWWPSRLMTRG
jgi:putative drug exporter of the RND superfamily